MPSLAPAPARTRPSRRPRLRLRRLARARRACQSRALARQLTAARVAALARAGLNSPQTARRLHLAQSTVTYHRVRQGFRRYRERVDSPQYLARRAAALQLLQAGCPYRRLALPDGTSCNSASRMVRRGRPPADGHLCAYCPAPATSTHHLSYWPEVLVFVCHPCHSRLHRLQEAASSLPTV